MIDLIMYSKWYDNLCILREMIEAREEGAT